MPEQETVPEWVATLIGQKEMQLENLRRENERLRERIRELQTEN